MLTEDDIKELGRELLRRVAVKSLYPSLHDDVGYDRVGDRYMLFKIDGYDLRSALYPWCSLEDFGFRAVTSSVSDVVAKGATPSYYAFSLGLDPSITIEGAAGILRGLADAIGFYGGALLNADTNIANTTWIDVAIVAFSDTPPIPRRGAKPGSRILIPVVGDPYICYHSLYVEKLRSCPSSTAAEKCCRPRVPIGVSTVLRFFRSCISASMDISDTLYETLYEIARLNNASIVIDADVSELLTRSSIAYAEERGIDLLEVLSSTYEEYLPVIVVEEKCVDDLLTALGKLGVRYVDAGYLAQGPPKVMARGRGELPSAKWSSTEASLHST